MTTNGWNTPYMNAQRFGREHSRPYVSNSTMLACRICDKIFLSTRSLIDHYQSHEDELAQQRQNHQRTPNNLPYNRQRREISLGNNPFNPRYHPYLQNPGYRPLQHAGQERIPIFNPNSSFPVPTQNNPQHYQMRNNRVSSLSPVSMTGMPSAGSTSQFVRNQPEVPNLQLGLGMLDQPIPCVIDLESNAESSDYIKLKLRH